MARSVLGGLLLCLLFCCAIPAVGATADAAKKPQENDYELYRILADTIDQVERNYVTKVNRRDLIESAIHGVLEKLDPYSSYIGPDDFDRFRNSIESEFGGIGIQIGDDDGRIQIISPMYGTPAYRAGLQAGDIIVEINGVKTDGMTLDTAIEKLKGDAGTSVTLSILHSGEKKPESVTVTREKIHIDTVLGNARHGDGKWEYMFDPGNRIGYIRLTAFSRNTPAELQGVLTQLTEQKMRALILDLRNDPGGLLTSAIEVCDLFVAQGRIVSTKGRNNPERVWDAHREGTFDGFPMVVLVNRYSASASEIVAACLQDNKRATVIGERTWGKGSVQNVIELENGHSALKLTTAAYRRPNGKNIHRFPDAKPTDEWGVMPDANHDVRLSDTEIVALNKDRRARDIVHSPANNAPPANEPLNDAQASASKVVDRQLQAAMKFLNTELAKAP